MPNQPLRRSQRIAAKAAKKEEEVVVDGNTAKSSNKKQSDIKSTSSSRRSSRLRSRSRSHTRRRCSLQSLEDKTIPTRQSPRRAKSQQKTTAKKKTCKKSPQKSKKTNATSHVESTFDETTSTMTPAVKPNQGIPTVTPNTVVVKPKGVKFNLGRNSFAQYYKENPPNIVEYLTDEVVAVSEKLMPVDDDDGDDDEATRRNEELLAEWGTNFDDLDICQVSRRTIRRVSMSS